MNCPAAVPYDEDAERAVAGAAIGFRDGHARLSRHVEPNDFYNPQLGRVFATAPRAWQRTPHVSGPPELQLGFKEFCASVEDDPQLLGRVVSWGAVRERELAMRLAIIARAARCDPGEVARIAADAVLSERLARRVSDMARRRRTMAEAATIYNQLAQGATLEQITGHLDQLLHERGGRVVA